METKEYKISGLHCQHCAERVTQTLKKLPEVKQVEVSQVNQSVTIQAEPMPGMQTMNDALGESGHYSISEF